MTPMIRTRQIPWLVALFVAWLAAWPTTWPGASAQAQKKDNRKPGLYWVMQTDLGTIQCKLFEAEAPIAVRTMVGLALGKISYHDDETTETVKKHFFDGLVFHRVVPNAMIQTGDPTGSGSGSISGPGFPYATETAPTLKFDVAGRMATANHGKDTNQSQFFITVGPLNLPANFTIWGQCDNLNVVKAISNVPSTGDQPNNPPHIKQVLIERVGPAPADAPEAQP